MSCRWQTKNVSAVRTKRREFKAEKEVCDGTGEIRGVFPATKRMQRQLLQIPFALVAAIALGAIIATCFAIEIFISELYNGPLKTYLVWWSFLSLLTKAYPSDLHPNHPCIGACTNYERYFDVYRKET